VKVLTISRFLIAMPLLILCLDDFLPFMLFLYFNKPAQRVIADQ
jgi:hypothetical protein